MNELRRDLKALRLENLLRGELDPLGKSIIQKAGQYPPPLPTSKRTGHLGRSWHYNHPGIHLAKH